MAGTHAACLLELRCFVARFFFRGDCYASKLISTGMGWKRRWPSEMRRVTMQEKKQLEDVRSCAGDFPPFRRCASAQGVPCSGFWCFGVLAFRLTQKTEAVAIIIGPDGSPYARAPYLFRFVFPWLGEEPVSHLQVGCRSSSLRRGTRIH